ncbi:MAG TPA: phosphoesterase, partial [Ruminococcaceae bacterium]|nr:phosphoesterase [Oscillospiraceae bacterium]
FLWLYWGNTSIRTTQVGIADKKIPASFSGFRIVQISDLHNA